MTEYVPQRKPHSYIPLEVRRIILRQAEILRYSAVEVSINTGIPLRTVQRIIERWKKMGEVIREPHREGPPRALTDQELSVSCGGHIVAVPS